MGGRRAFQTQNRAELFIGKNMCYFPAYFIRVARYHAKHNAATSINSFSGDTS